MANAAVQTANVSPAGFDQPGTRCPETCTATASTAVNPSAVHDGRHITATTATYTTAAVPFCPMAAIITAISAQSPASIAHASRAGTRSCIRRRRPRIHENTAR